MLFNSLGFFFFLAIVLAFYYAPFFKWNQKKGMLLLASYVFYGLWNPPLVLLLWISTLVDWTVGNQLYKSEDPRRRKALLLISILVNLGFLGFFKYGSFLVENFSMLMSLLGISYTPAAPDIILPMGISFYTFQTMSYSIDMYYRKIKPARTFLDFALYVTFFPQLVAGPIVRSADLVPQFYEPKKVSWTVFYWGAFLLTLGLFEKVVLADVLMAPASDQIFGNGAVLSPLDAWVGTLAFSGQIFFDFAGYSICAIGIAMMLGITIPDNFRFPYAARGFSDFWRRWHISLSTWLRDYLYIPLGGNRKGNVRTQVNLMLTMLLGGLWHGAAWTFVFWGLLHGIYLILERWYRAVFKLPRDRQMEGFPGLLAAFATFMCINITWVFFRAQTFDKAISMLGSMFFITRGGEVVLPELDIWIVLTVITGLFLIHWSLRNASVLIAVRRTPFWLLGVVWGVMIILLVLAQGTGQQFIYFQF